MRITFVNNCHCVYTARMLNSSFFVALVYVYNFLLQNKKIYNYVGKPWLNFLSILTGFYTLPHNL